MPTFRVVLVLLTLVVVAPEVAQAQNWPDRPVHFIVPFPAGGSIDAAARLIGESLSRTLGQPVVIENKSGANGNIGIESVARSAPDGYTVLFGSDAVSTNPHVYQMTVDPLKDLVPVIEVARQPIALAAHPSLGVTTLAELTALAQHEAGLRFATGSGFGSLQAMVGLWYAKLAGITLVQVPYRGGGQAISDLIAGHVKLGSFGTTPLVPHYQNGALRLLAQSMEARSPTLPNVPTFQEAGMNGLVVTQRAGVFVPSGTPAEIVARLNSEINAALRDERVKRTFAGQAQDPTGGTPEDYAKLVREDFDKTARLVRDLKLKAE